MLGRTSGSTDFKSYSSALKGAKLVWDQATLDRFLAGPGKVVPATRMVIAVADPKQRAEIIAFLATRSLGTVTLRIAAE